MDESKDQLERRCPRLGGPVTFQYCRQCGEDDIPCWKIVDCWWEYFDIVAFLKQSMSRAKFAQLLNSKPKPKLRSLIELVEQAKKRC